MNSYTSDELVLIQQHETARLNAAQSAFEEARVEHDAAKSRADRWRDSTFRQQVSLSRSSLLRASSHGFVIVLSFLLNCVLVQELMPDLTPRVQHLFGIGAGSANFLATLMITGILFAILLVIKDRCDTTADRAALRPGLHPAVAKPIRRRLHRKLAIKVTYLLVLLFAYSKLYNYIAGGVEIEQLARASDQELRASARSTLADPNPTMTDLDAGIADSQAASFATYYALEWFLHTVILFVGLGQIMPENPALAFLRAGGDEKRHREAQRRFHSSTTKLRILCQPLAHDDGLNPLRAAIQNAAGLDRTTVSDSPEPPVESLPQVIPDPSTPYRSNGSRSATQCAA